MNKKITEILAPAKANDGEVVIKWINPGPIPAQIYSNGLEYSFVSEKMEQCNRFVWCKDFLNDVVFGSLYGKSASIYGFTYDPAKHPALSFDRTRLLLTNSADGKMGEKMPGALDFINQMEDHLGLRKTIIKPCAQPSSAYTKCGVWYFEGSPIWMTANPLLSLYTLGLRVGFMHTVGKPFRETMDEMRAGKIKPYQTHDHSYLTQSKIGVDAILERGYRKIFFKDIKKNYPSGKGISIIHNVGIVGFSQGQGNSITKYWGKKAFGPLEPAAEAVVTE